MPERGMVTEPGQGNKAVRNGSVNDRKGRLDLSCSVKGELKPSTKATEGKHAKKGEGKRGRGRKNFSV